ncbi:hypothetical protein K458DRAFT_349337 [Lentithecium fluviatile CBS 122367]|uniref:Uncharacterized protein n=1 Tax=Lentithecium fluviatile CBS 122367 TaxID=1168545 RepID=A0A6G1IJ17_9PLEO|nr:hypothetical protein K458DRAFT_349337 [Lentithecium fluviatile CBS 122367]
MPALATVLASFTILAAYYLYWQPRNPPWLPLFRPKYRPGALVVGISVSANYGTVSIRHEDGSFEDIGRIEADRSYVDMIQRCALPSSGHAAYPHYTMEDIWADWPRQNWRSFRESLFLPASANVGRLSKLTRSLIKLARAHAPSQPIVSVVISFPFLYGLYDEDAKDVASYLWLPELHGTHGAPPHTFAAAFAGHGMGLCTSYTDRDRCWEEGRKFPERSVLLVEYTATSILLSADFMHGVHGSGSRSGELSTYFSPSINERNGEHDQGQTRSQVLRKMVLDLANGNFKRGPIPGFPDPPKAVTVLLTGSPDDIAKDDVREVVMEAVKAADFDVEMFDENPEFVAARGAAELAWRALALTIEGERESFNQWREPYTTLPPQLRLALE